jgi:transcriptional regulator with PAS, ATPase and Fis domain
LIALYLAADVNYRLLNTTSSSPAELSTRIEMFQILFIVPYEEMRDTVAAVLKRYPLRDQIESRIVVSPVDRIDFANIGCCDAIVARGYSARELAQGGLDVPVVEIEISGYDVIASVQKASAHFAPKSIAFIGFYNAFNGIKNLSGMFGCEINVYIPRDVSDLPTMVRRAIDEGCDTVIGGYSVKGLAREYGANAIGLESGEESIGQALEEAIRAVEIIRQERIKAETHRIITQLVKNGIVYVDADGVIREDNIAARAMASCELKGRRLADVFPHMEDSYTESLLGIKESTGQIRQIGDIAVSLDCMPVVVDAQPAGVVISFQNVTRVQQLERQIREKMHEKGLTAKYHFSDVVHQTPIISNCIATARRYAPLPFNVLITGETGTGKELFAQSIHNESSRKDGPFVAVNCAALPENLLESELFGYVEGAFTGTNKGGKAGLFELAHGGTLFLDEIAEIPVSVQGKLLRTLQEREVRRIGADKVIAVDVRVISATNNDLRDFAVRGLFRRDLLYRIDVLTLSVPPLRHRPDDIVALFSYFLKRYCDQHSIPVPHINPRAFDLLRAYEFPGNVRELRNVAARASVLHHDPRQLSAEDIELALYPDGASHQAASAIPSKETTILPGGAGRVLAAIDEEERHRTLEALTAARGKRGKAAKLLGIDRSTLWRRLQKYR